MRVFLDTNVLVAAFVTHGLCEDIFRCPFTWGVAPLPHCLGARLGGQEVCLSPDPGGQTAIVIGRGGVGWRLRLTQSMELEIYCP